MTPDVAAAAVHDPPPRQGSDDIDGDALLDRAIEKVRAVQATLLEALQLVFDGASQLVSCRGQPQ